MTMMFKNLLTFLIGCDICFLILPTYLDFSLAPVITYPLKASDCYIFKT